MSDTMNVIEMNQIATVLSELVHSYSELARCWYEVFHDPSAKSINIRLLDENGNLKDYIIPNRALDKNYIHHGDTDPEGVYSANTGSLYQNTKTGRLFIKAATEGYEDGASVYNWREIQPLDTVLLSGEVEPENKYPSKDFPYGVMYAHTLNGNIYSNTPDGWKTVGATGFAEEAWCRREFENIKAQINQAVVHIDGEESINGAKTFKARNVFKEVTTFEKVIMGTAYRALSADIAEYYEADKDYKPGTLIQFGGDKEVTGAKDMVNAIVSTAPAYILNGGADMEHPTLLALSGRVPVRVKGKVDKFDLIKLSDEEGVAIVDNSCYNPIGRALEANPNEEEKLVECVVKLNI